MWITTAWQCISPEVTVKGSKVVVYPMQWMRLMMICCGMTVKRTGILKVSMKVETVTLIGNGA